MDGHARHGETYSMSHARESQVLCRRKIRQSQDALCSPRISPTKRRRFRGNVLTVVYATNDANFINSGSDIRVDDSTTRRTQRLLPRDYGQRNVDNYAQRNYNSRSRIRSRLESRQTTSTPRATSAKRTLWHSPRGKLWFEKYTKELESQGFTPCHYDPSLFCRWNANGKVTYVAVYVDDSIITGSDDHGIEQIREHILKTFGGTSGDSNHSWDCKSNTTKKTGDLKCDTPPTAKLSSTDSRFHPKSNLTRPTSTPTKSNGTTSAIPQC